MLWDKDGWLWNRKKKMHYLIITYNLSDIKYIRYLKCVFIITVCDIIIGVIIIYHNFNV